MLRKHRWCLRMDAGISEPLTQVPLCGIKGVDPIQLVWKNRKKSLQVLQIDLKRLHFHATFTKQRDPPGLQLPGWQRLGAGDRSTGSVGGARRCDG